MPSWSRARGSATRPPAESVSAERSSAKTATGEVTAGLRESPSVQSSGRSQVYELKIVRDHKDQVRRGTGSL